MALSQSEALMAVKRQLEAAKMDFNLSQKAYNDIRLKIKAFDSLKKELDAFLLI